MTLPMDCNFGDLANDGYFYFYFYQGTGHPEYETIPNVTYRSLEGTVLADVTMAVGFGHLQKGHGVSFTDLD